VPLSTYAANLIGNALTDQGTYTAPANYYLSLCVDAPDASMTGTTLSTAEPTDGSFYRPMFPDWNWSTLVNGVSTYDTQINLVPTNDWGLVSYFAICDAATAGNVIWFGSLTSAFYVYANGSYTNYVPAGYIRLTVT